ncbi:MAG: BMC domain-containing protein [Planctomycetota bacterium]|jgi:microcompartment protein CcmL/EutN
MTSTQPCIGLLEYNSIGWGISATDQILKKAKVKVIFAKPVCPGKYTVLFTGEVEDVKSSLRIGYEIAETSIVDELFIPNVVPGVLAALNCATDVTSLDAVGVIETFSCASGIIAADIAAKTGRVELIEIRLAMGIGGKSFVTFTGEVSDVRAAVTAGARDSEERGLLASKIVIPKPHPDMLSILL